MIEENVLDGKWTELKGRLREKWGQLTDDELDQARGSFEQLIGAIKRRTGEADADIRAFVEDAAEDMVEDSAGTDYRDTVQQAADTAAAYAAGMKASAEECRQAVADQAREGFERTEKLVKKRPLESLATSFGAGLLAGLVIGALVRSK